MMRSFVLSLLAALGLASVVVHAEERTLPSAAGPVTLPSLGGQVGVGFSNLRLNRAAGSWDVSVLVSNAGPQTVRSPFLLRFDVATGVGGGPGGAQTDADGKIVVDISDSVGVRGIAAGRAIAPLTLSFPTGSGAPNLAATAFGRPDSNQLRYPSPGGEVVLDAVAPGSSVTFRAFRLNRATGAWAVDLVISNPGPSTISAPLVLRFDEASPGVGAMAAATVIDGVWALDLSSRVPAGGVGAGGTMASITLEMGRGTGTPQLRGSLFRAVSQAPPPTPPGSTVFAVRTLDDAGLPMAGVDAVAVGGTGHYQSDRGGWLSLRGEAELTGWRFSRDGFESAFRPVPDFAAPATDLGSVRLNRTPDLGTALVDDQSLPGPMPGGWSIERVAAFPVGSASFALSPVLAADESAALVRWDADVSSWIVVAQPPVSASTVDFTAAAPAVYALVIGDSGPRAPPAPTPGSALGAGDGTFPAIDTLRGEGRMIPASRPASRVASEVTSTGEVTLRSTAGALASGSAFRSAVHQTCQLRDGSRRVLPVYTTSLIGYRRRGDITGNLVARFPLRPIQLLGADELVETLVSVDILGPSDFAGVVLDPAGGSVTNGDIAITAAAGTFGAGHAALLRSVPATDFTGVAATPLQVVAAFELEVDGLGTAKRLNPTFSAQSPNANFVLARAVYDEGRFGLQPVERFGSMADGLPVSREPTDGSGLGGVDGGGEYLLLAGSEPGSVITGVVRDAAGLPVRSAAVEQGPWLAFSDDAGGYRLLAPPGDAVLRASQPGTGDTAFATLHVPAGGAPLTRDIVVAPSGPRVLALSPTNESTGVSRVTAVKATFSKSLNPATVVAPGSVVLLDNNQAVIAAATSLNLAGNILSLLPTSQLPPSQLLTLRLAGTIRDGTGAAIEGPTEFRFTTESDALNRGAAAQVTIFEPGARVVPAELLARIPAYDPARDRDGIVIQGSQGTAEGGKPVILVNESTGETATVLAEMDGSFVSMIRGSSDDFISAVVVNANGSRNSIPASRQNFDDGSVGLYRGGGKLEAQGDGGPVEVIIEPGAIPTKTRLKIETVPMSLLTSLLAAAPPAGATALGAFRFLTDGDDLRTAPIIRLPASAQSVTVPPGESPTNAAFVITRAVDVDGVKVYEVLDSARFDGTAIVAEAAFDGLKKGLPLADSSGFPGSQAVPSSLRKSPRLQLVGPIVAAYLTMQLNRVIRATTAKSVGLVSSCERDSNGAVIQSSITPVVGAAVRSVTRGTGPGKRVIPGDLVSLTDGDGRYRMLSPLDALVTPIQMEATSPLFGSQIAVGRKTVVIPAGFTSEPIVIRIDLGFQRGDNGAAALDREPPLVRVSHTPDFIATNLSATVRVFANDDLKLQSLNVTVDGVFTPAGFPLDRTNLTLQLQQGSIQQPQTIRNNYDAFARVPLEGVIKALATDTSGKTNQVLYRFSIPSREFPPAADPTDTTGPFVVDSTPRQGEEGVTPGTSIRLVLNEPVSPSFVSNPTLHFSINPPAGTPNCYLTDGGTVVELTYFKLQPGQRYHLTVTTQLRDLNGNFFDQNPYNNSVDQDGRPVANPDSFVLRFTMADLTPVALPDVVNAMGSFSLGDRCVVVDRRDGKAGRLSIYDVSAPSHPSLLHADALQAFPRSFTVFTNFSFVTRINGAVRTATVVVVAGGLVGESGQWIEAYALDALGNPDRIVRTTLSPSPAAVVTKIQPVPPRFGYLESDADQTAVGLVDLQLMILADNLTEREFGLQPAGGDAGLDANGDGDYVDVGDRLPRPDGSHPRFGVLNGGLVGKYVLPSNSTQRIFDFDTRYAGNFIGVLATLPGGNSEYRTLVSAGVPLTGNGPTLALGVPARKIKLLFGETLETSYAGEFTANIALISTASSQELKVLDVTDAGTPFLINAISLPPASGNPHLVQEVNDHLLALGTSTDQLMLARRRLALILAGTGAEHPALVGQLPGFGGGAFPFLNDTRPLVGVASGGTAKVAGSLAAADVVLLKPGTMLAPGPAVPSINEDDADANLVFANTDFDETDAGFTGTPTRDFQRPTKGVFDNDLLGIVLRRLPARFGSEPVKGARLRIEMSGSTALVPVVRMYTPDGVRVVPSTETPTLLEIESTLLAPGQLLGDALRNDVILRLEGTEPFRGVVVRWQALNANGGVISEDTCKFSIVDIEMTAFWSRQFPDARSNYIPANNGANRADGYILMANVADGTTEIGATVIVKPPVPAIQNRVLVRIYPIREKLCMGTSARFGDEYHVTALDTRTLPPIPLLAPSMYSAMPPMLEELVVAGMDYDGDGDLSVHEIRATYTNAPMRKGTLIYTPIGGVRKLAEPHVKTVTKGFWMAQFVADGPLGLLAAFAAIYTPDPYAQPGDSALGMSLGTTHLELFMNGIMPLTPFAPDRVGTYDVPDNLRHVNGRSLQNYNTGPFAATGFHTVPLYRYPPGGKVVDFVRASTGFRNTILRNLGARLRANVPTQTDSPKAFLRVLRSAAAAQPPGSTAPFVVSFDFSRSAGTATELNGTFYPGLGEGSFLELGLFVGVGGFILQDLHVDVTADIPGPGPYAPDSKIRIRKAFVRTVIQDLYDWDLTINPFAAVLSAGNGTYGSGGQNFQVEFPIEGEVNYMSLLSDDVLVQ